MRPLDISGQKVVQKALEMALSIIFERDILPCSHGFLVNRGVHRCLKSIKKQFVHLDWIIEGDIRNCFGSMDHDILIKLVAQKVHCPKTLALIRKHITAGYVEKNGGLVKPKLGIPQGSILSPVLANIYITELDRFMIKLVDRNKVTTKPRYAF